MSTRRYRLDDPVGPNGESREAMILAGIRAGGYPHVAAEAWGVPAKVFRRWLERGKDKKAPAWYRRLARAVRRAVGQARLLAETIVFKDDMHFWLRHGPGKEMPGSPGWSALAKPWTGTHQSRENFLLSPEFQAIRTLLDSTLEPFPEAHAAVVRGFAESVPNARMPRQ
jgi:hypothetical protein